MVVPPYCVSRAGRVYRIHRLSEALGEDRMRFTLRATPIRAERAHEGKQASREIDTAQVREKIAARQVVPTPEETYEQLWQQLRLDVDAVDKPVDDPT